MAETLAAAITYFAEAAGYAITASEALTAAYAVIIVSSVAISNAQRRSAENAQRSALNESLKDRELMIRSAVAPRRTIYGRDKVSGPIVYAFSNGDKGQFLHIVIKLADHECDAIETVYFNEVALPNPDVDGGISSGPFALAGHVDASYTVSTDGSGVATLPAPVTSITTIDQISGSTLETTNLTGWSYGGGTSITGLPPSQPGIVVSYRNNTVRKLVHIEKHLGQSSQVASAELISQSGGVWTSNHAGHGVCYLYVQLEYESDVFGQIGLPNISAVVRGKKVFDPRNSTTVWSQNAALCIADWLRTNPYGIGASSPQVPNAEVANEANISDEVIALDGSGATQPRYVINNSFETTISPQAALEQMLSDCAGRAVWTQGRWLLRVGAYRTPGDAITTDELAGPVTIVPRITRTSLFNAVRVTYKDPAQDWAVVQAPLVTNTTYEAQDGGVRIVRDIQYSSNMDPMRAQRLGKIELERARQSVGVTMVCNLRAYDHAPTDTAPITIDRYGWAAKVFEVLERGFDRGGKLSYTMQETAASVYAWNFGQATVVDPAPDTNLPDPYAPITPVTGLIIQSGTNELLPQADGSLMTRAFLQWTPSATSFVADGGRTEIQWRTIVETDWHDTPFLSGEATNAFVGPLPDGIMVLFRVRAVNALGRASVWNIAAHQVVGKTQPPSNVAGMTAQQVVGGVKISWTEGRPLNADYAKTILKELSVWNDGAASLFEGDASSYTWLAPPQGSHLVLAKHQDTTGNRSTNATGLSFTIDANGLVQWTSINGRPKSFRVGARGFSDTQGPLLGLYDPETGSSLTTSSARSYNFARISRASGGVAFFDRFDIFGGGADAAGQLSGSTLTARMNETGADSIAVVWTSDEPQSNRLSGALPAAMYRCGASQGVFGSPLFKVRSAYVLVGIGGCGEGNGFEAYNGSIDADTNAWCDVAFQIQNGALNVTGSGATPRTLRDYSYTGTLDATSDVALIAGGGCLINGNTATKTGATGAYDASAYSRDGYTGGAFMSASVTSTHSSRPIFGLNTDPTADNDYGSIDYGIHASSNWQLYAFESGAAILIAPSYTVDDVLTVQYDGARVYYLQNGNVRRAVAAPAGLKFYFDSSMLAQGDVIRNIRFGPMSAVADIGTGQLAPGAATEIRDYLSPVSGSNWNGTDSNPTIVAGDTFIPVVACTIVVTVTFEALGQAAWDARRYLNVFADPFSDTSGGSFLGSSAQIGTPQSITTARAAYSIRASFNVTAGVTWMVGLCSTNVPSGSGNQVWNVRVHTELIKR
jgi:hypothetical protein